MDSSFCRVPGLGFPVCQLSYSFRSSHRKCSLIKGVLRNFAKFTGKHLCQTLFFNKVGGLRLATSLKHTFSCEFLRNFKEHLFTEHLWATASLAFDYIFTK